MIESFSAFGLSITARFPIPGEALLAAEPKLPGVVLEIESPQRLEAEWSGSISPRAWCGRLGDGQEFAIEWGRGGDLLFRYGARARFRLDPAGARLGCAPSDPAAVAWQRVLLTRVLPNVGIARGYEALHASAVSTDCGVVAIAAASGAGKSTLARELMGRGWPLFADDTVVLGRNGNVVEAHPSSPFVNLPAAGGDVGSLGIDLGVLDGERWVAVADLPATSSGVAAIVLLERGPGMSLGAEPMRESPLALAPFMLGLPDDDDRDAARFDLYADLVEGARMLRLTAGTEHQPADLAETLERALGLGSRVMVEGTA